MIILRKYKVFKHDSWDTEDLENILNNHYEDGYDIYEILNSRGSYGGTTTFVYIMKKGVEG